MASAIDRFGRFFEHRLAMPLIVAASLYLRFSHLGHRTIATGDEGCHALVARNLLRHPLMPTLIEVPWLPFDYRFWSGNHIWLHKPILPLWQIALSYSAFGINAFALRLPSAILATATVVLTYLIGRDLFDRRTGWIAAAFLGISPIIERIVQGYLFSDHVDIALLFWTELGLYFGLRAIRGGRMRDAVLAGIACGLAYLSKYFLGLLVPALLFAVLILTHFRLIDRATVKLRWRHAIACVLVACMTAAPWLAWCFLHFRRELLYEHFIGLAHLSGDVEGWSAPWDRLVGDYFPMMQAFLFMPVVVAASLLWFTSLRENRLGLWFLYSWLGIVVLPHLLAASKTPTSTMLAIPAGCLMFGALLSAASRADCIAAIGCVAGSFAGLLGTRDFSAYGIGPSPSGRFGGALLEQPWLMTQLAAAGAGIVVMLSVAWLVARIPRRFALVSERSVAMLLTSLAFALAVALGTMSVQDSRRVAALNWTVGSFVELGAWAKSALEPNAVLLIDTRKPGDVLRAMLFSDRTCYSTTLSDLPAVAGLVREAGGIPYLLSKKVLSTSPARYSDPIERWRVCEWTEGAAAPAPTRK